MLERTELPFSPTTRYLNLNFQPQFPPEREVPQTPPANPISINTAKTSPRHPAEIGDIKTEAVAAEPHSPPKKPAKPQPKEPHKSKFSTLHDWLKTALPTKFPHLQRLLWWRRAEQGPLPWSETDTWESLMANLIESGRYDLSDIRVPEGRLLRMKSSESWSSVRVWAENQMPWDEIRVW